MWALCRREHGLTWTEFQDLTLAEFEALEERRSIEIRHARFNAALVASAICNGNGGEVSPFDFLAGFERDQEAEEKEKRRREIKREIGYVFARIAHKTAEEVQAKKLDVIERMAASGIEDPEGLIREVYPDL